jgi:outer membrane protein OmpA-like peptidoglycan-associated protein
MKQLILFFVLLFSYVVTIAQNRLFDMVLDKQNNIYVIGSFDETIDLGNNTQLTSNGETDIFVGKYNASGKCQWGLRIGGRNDDEAGGICIDTLGNIYITGTFIDDAYIGESFTRYASNKANHAATFFATKLNPSGDPVWTKISKNKKADIGVGISIDNSGNIYAAGNFEGEFILDDKRIKSNGKHDICLVKLNSDGVCAWVKTYGDKEDNLANTLFTGNNKIVLGGNSHAGLAGFTGYVAEINTESGNVNWTKNIGSIKGHIEKIIHDGRAAYYITGSIEGSNPMDETYQCFVTKVNDKNGEDIWVKSFESNQAKGNDMVCDNDGNLYITGSFLDSLKINQTLVKGKELEDIFLIKLSSVGQVLLGEDYGHSKSDIGRKLFYRDNKLIMSGEFSNDIEFGTTLLTGGENTFFVAFFDPSVSQFKNAQVLANHLQKPVVNTKLSNITGKIIVANGDNKNYLSGHEVHIEEESGELIKSTLTDEKGNFTFKNIDTTKVLNLVVKKNDRIKENEEVYLAKINGTIIQKFNLDKDNVFRFKLLKPDIIKLSEPDNVTDPLIALKDFENSSNTEMLVVEHVLYDVNAFQIPVNAIVDMDKIAKYLIENSTYSLQIYSHTDATGDEKSNLELSQKRANEVKKYLVGKGIKSSRIKAKGLGETKILNRCNNEINCSPEEHAMNRRTEFMFSKSK